jgi:hypothetical protein
VLTLLGPKSIAALFVAGGARVGLSNPGARSIEWAMMRRWPASVSKASPSSSLVCVANKLSLRHIHHGLAEAAFMNHPSAISARPRLAVDSSSTSVAGVAHRSPTRNLTMALAAVDRLVGDVGEDAVRRMRRDVLTLFPIGRHRA